MAPCCFACSLAFLFPVGTPPNAIAFATGAVSAAEMRAAGAWLTLAVGLVLALVCWLLLPGWVATSEDGASAMQTPLWAAEACHK
jgi:sodium-dependent dicarboxylate transporter 2/3/5